MFLLFPDHNKTQIYVYNHVYCKYIFFEDAIETVGGGFICVITYNCMLLHKLSKHLMN